MNIKELVADKFWIVENNNGKVGTIRKLDTGYEFFDQRTKTTEMIESIKNFKATKVVEKNQECKIHEGYPTNSPTVFAYQHDSLPTFKKKENSKLVFSAGYYILKYSGMGWQHAFCPKLETLNNYQYRGPYLTEWDMNINLKKARKE